MVFNFQRLGAVLELVLSKTESARSAAEGSFMASPGRSEKRKVAREAYHSANAAQDLGRNCGWERGDWPR